MSTRSSGGAPTLVPPDQRGSTRSRSGGTTAGTGPGTSRPADIDLEAAAAATAPAGPILSPPGTADAAGTAAGGVTGTWSGSLTVDGTWAINEKRNAYFHVAGGGWKKVFNGTDGAFNALLTLVTQAKQSGHPVVVREEADGLVHEVYLW